MKRFFYLLISLFILVNFYFATFYVSHGEINFHTDVARDFLLFQEVDMKKIILIGPRSSTAGIFHGPLWIYLNYPAYLLGHGDPVVVGWFWIVLTVIFVGSGFVVAKKLFGNRPAFIYALLLSGNMMFYTRSLFNPHGALFLIPVYFYTMVLYFRQQRFWQLALHLFLGAMIIQFQMAIGIPFVILSTLVIFYLIWKTKKYSHLLAYFIFLGSLSNFFIFELRHNFIMTHAILNYASPVSSLGFYNYFSQIDDRINRLLDLQISWNIPGSLTGFFFAYTALLTYRYVKARQNNWDAVLLLVYYFAGYILLTFVNKGVVLEHQYFPVLALSTLWFAAMIESKQKKLYGFLLILALVFNYRSLFFFINDAQTKFFNQDQNSWRGLQAVAWTVFTTSPKEFGYFVYSPDAFAYQPRYAMIYMFAKAGKIAHEWQKWPVTYVIAAPPPPDKPGIGYLWWRTDRANIKATPSATYNISNGFTVEKFNLTPEQQKVPYEPTINLGIFFR